MKEGKCQRHATQHIAPQHVTPGTASRKVGNTANYIISTRAWLFTGGHNRGWRKVQDENDSSQQPQLVCFIRVCTETHLIHMSHVRKGASDMSKTWIVMTLLTLVVWSKWQNTTVLLNKNWDLRHTTIGCHEDSNLIWQETEESGDHRLIITYMNNPISEFLRDHHVQKMTHRRTKDKRTLQPCCNI